MSDDRWRRAEEIFHAALERQPQVRSAFLDEACADDAELRRQVGLLVSKDEEAGSFLEAPALAAMAETGVARVGLAPPQLGRYRTVSLLGAGGMGEVYRAHDTTLGRDVAIKTLPPEFAHDPMRLARLRREARALASLNHPNIAAIYELEESPEAAYLVLELVPGEALEGPLPLATALERASQVADALQAAHEHGIVHRDLKPANVTVTPGGRVKVLDFGLAKAIREPALSSGPSQSLTGTGTVWHVVGTPGYMSPEQARGAEVDERTDIWAFGCLLYELLAGVRAFKGESLSDTIAAVLEHEPDWKALPANTPATIRTLLGRCLCKDVNDRLRSISAARAIIDEARRPPGRWRSTWATARQPRFAVPIAAILLLAGAWGVRAYRHNERVRWVRDQAIPEIGRLRDAGERAAAFRLMRRAEALLPQDAALKRIQREYGVPATFQTNPAGAEVWATGYTPDDNDWVRLGTTPFTTLELPLGFYRFRIVKPGFRTIVGTGEVRGGTALAYDLDREGSLPAQTVRVSGGRVSVAGVGSAQLSAFLIDRDEITNRQFKQFVERGGYRDRTYWKQDFVRDGRAISWEDAMPSFRDATGRPGPSTWEVGEYPAGRDDYPVNGVSWYEAAAFAEFAGKQLPTVYHWEKAASPGWFAEIAGLSNFKGTGPAPVGAYKGLGPFGTLDLAGNVREWCWNENAGKRYLRGGAWDEPEYMFAALDASSPWDRSARNGIRLARYHVPDGSAVTAPVTTRPRDFSQDTPASDEVFNVYRSLYAYDPADLAARSEGVDDENAYWRREKISFAAAYGNERVLGYLYLPKRARPPYQAIIYAHPGMALRLPSPQPGEQPLFDFLVKSGRAFLLPVLKGHYQRRYAGPATGPNDLRDRLILESKDFRRSIDYLASRADIDRDRLGVYGISRGSLLPVLAVGERRLKAAVLVSVGLSFERGQLPQADPFDFLPRFEVPTVMICGRSDFSLPLETSQRPMFRLLGAPERDKRLVSIEGGHFASDIRAVKEATLDWFDRYLGPVR